MKPIAVIGEGAWGTAIAQVIADNGHSVRLWCCDAFVSTSINTQQVNARYMPGFVLPKTICADTHLETVLADCSFVFVSTPTVFFRKVIMQCKPYYKKEQCWVVLSKGIENESLLVPTQILVQILDANITRAVLGGPSFAQEVMARKLTGVTVAATDISCAGLVADLVRNAYFYPYLTTDILGVQLGGALKNVMALLMGIAQGAEYADNTRAFLFTRCWAELISIAVSLGAQSHTLFDLAGLGDVFLTVTGTYSRNFALGVAIGKGDRIKYEQKAICELPEGINTLCSLEHVASMRKLNVPLFEALYAIIFESAHTNRLLQAVVLSGPVEAK